MCVWPIFSNIISGLCPICSPTSVVKTINIAPILSQPIVKKRSWTNAAKTLHCDLLTLYEHSKICQYFNTLSQNIPIVECALLKLLQLWLGDLRPDLEFAQKKQKQKHFLLPCQLTLTLAYRCHYALIRSQISKAYADTFWPSTEQLATTVVWSICQTLQQPPCPWGKTCLALQLHTVLRMSESSERNESSLLWFSVQDEEQLCEIKSDDSPSDLEKTENQFICIGGDSGCEHQEDLLEGDLGLGTAPALAREAWSSRSHL